MVICWGTDNLVPISMFEKYSLYRSGSETSVVIISGKYDRNGSLTV